LPTPTASAITPGSFVRHPARPDWGLGQVQSAVDGRITVNFEHAGKVLVNAAVVSLQPISEAELDVTELDVTELDVTELDGAPRAPKSYPVR